MARLVGRVIGEGEGTGSIPPLVDLFPLFFLSFCFLLFTPPVFYYLHPPVFIYLFAFILFTAFILRHLIYFKA
jgi:hypothetical protein